MLGLEKSSGEEYPPEPEAPERPREAALEMEAKEAVDEINESSLIVLTTFSSNGWLNKRLSVPEPLITPASQIPQQDKKCELNMSPVA